MAFLHATQMSSIMTALEGLEIVFLPSMTTDHLWSLSPNVFLAPLASKLRNLSNAKYGGTDSVSQLNLCHSRMADWLNLSSAAAVMNVLKQSCFIALSAHTMYLLVEQIVQKS